MSNRASTETYAVLIRATALGHGLLSYLLGAVVSATVINLVAGLGGNSGGEDLRR
jgi:uncharacterized membrane protein